jgi:helix-turn-helix protein
MSFPKIERRLSCFRASFASRGPDGRYASVRGHALLCTTISDRSQGVGAHPVKRLGFTGIRDLELPIGNAAGPLRSKWRRDLRGGDLLGLGRAGTARPAVCPPQTRRQRYSLVVANASARLSRSWTVSCYLSRLFADEPGYHFNAVVNGLRVLMSALLLRSTQLSIKEIAAEVGFARTSALDRQFPGIGFTWRHLSSDRWHTPRQVTSERVLVTLDHPAVT